MAVIEFEHVTKTYRLGQSVTSMREALPNAFRSLRRGQKDPADNREFLALSDVSFSVEQGEVLGIVGHNGAGKSTILKLLSSITFPTSGRIHTQGRLAALIELGAGFHPDLSGRDNVYLNGSILGLTRREIDERFSNIVAFAELERFIDTPLKRYSSGMYVRLAFAVATHVQADLLLVDEVLSVGDMEFQRKSLAKMNDLRDSGATIVFISHNLSAVRTFCDRALLLSAGKVIIDGDTTEIIDEYKRLENQKRRSATGWTPAGAMFESASYVGPETPSILGVDIIDASGHSQRELSEWEPVTICCRIRVPTSMVDPICTVRVRRQYDGFICFACDLDAIDQQGLCGELTLHARFDQLQLVPGPYILETRLYTEDDPGSGVDGIPEPFRINGELLHEDHGVFQPDLISLEIIQQRESAPSHVANGAHQHSLTADIRMVGDG
jgi:ABC-type polysaccharide/polyol phosphate transport system ATPase subunit